MAEPTADAGAHGSETAGGDKPFKVFMTQAEFDAHAAGIRAAVERKAKAITPDERARIDVLEKELENRQVRDLEMEKNYSEAAALRDKQAKEAIAKAEAKAQKLASSLQRIAQQQVAAFAAAHGAYDPEDVVVRMMPRITVDEDGSIHVSDAPGGPVQDGVSLEQAVAELLTTKPHLAKAAGGAGAGTRGGASLNAPVAGSPAMREAQARYDDAVKLAAANPTSPDAIAAVLTAKAALKQATAK